MISKECEACDFFFQYPAIIAQQSPMPRALKKTYLFVRQNIKNKKPASALKL